MEAEVEKPPVRRAEDDLADGSTLVVDVAGGRVQARVIERVGPAQRHLLLRGEEELDPRVLAPFLEHAASRLEHDDDRGLVVRAEDGAARVADDPVLADDRLDRAFRRHRVQMGAEKHWRAAVAVRRREAAVDVARVTLEARGRVVLVPLEPQSGEVAGDAVSDRALVPGRARHGAQLQEEIDQGRRQRLLHAEILRACPGVSGRENGY
jgi:hypothetical protein